MGKAAIPDEIRRGQIIGTYDPFRVKIYFLPVVHHPLTVLLIIA